MMTLFGEVEDPKPWGKFEGIFLSETVDWATPEKLYCQLDSEFYFNFDPCPLGGGVDGLLASWIGKRVYCNPPYGPGIEKWLRKATEATVAVFLLPARTDTRWFHELGIKANEIRFVKGRLVFGGAEHGAPFPSIVLVFRKPGL